jgi:hypothetical protein
MKGNGRLMIDGEEYVHIDLFEAANAHVREQGLYCNQLIEATNLVANERRELREQVAKLRAELLSLKQSNEPDLLAMVVARSEAY